MTFLLQQTVIYTVPLILVALAGVFAERSGIINLALEGIMIIGAFAGAWFVRSMQVGGWNENLAQLLLLAAMLVTAAAGTLFSMLLSFSAVKMKADQTIGGTALNLLAPAVVLFLVNITFQQNTLNLRYDAPSWFMLFQTDFGFERKAKLGLVGDLLLNKTYLTTYIGILIYVVLSVILYKTRFGLRLRACGEHPQAADSVGINVYRMRYAGVLISGALGGLGGLVYITAGVSEWKFENGVAGFGFLALAVMIFGQWKPVNIGLAALLFGLFRALSNVYTGFDALVALKLPSTVYNMFPYIISLVVLVFVSKKSRAPKAEGIPYDKGQR